MHVLVLLLIFWLPIQAMAGAVITYHGRIVDSAKRPVESSAVTFKIRIYSPTPGKCLLYEELRTISMLGSGGVFVIPIGDGNASRTENDPAIQMEKIFANDPNLTFNKTNTPKLVCNSASSYTPQLLDQRLLYVSFDDHSGVGEQELPVMDLNYVPLAVSSYDAQHLGGTPAESVLRLSSGSATPLSLANFLELLNVVNGSSTQYQKNGQLNGSSLPSLSNGQVLGWNGNWVGITPLTSYTETDPSVKNFAKSDLPTTCGTDKFLRPKSDGSGFDCVVVSGANGGTVTSVTPGVGLLNVTTPGNPISTTGTLAVDVGTDPKQIIQMGSDGKLPAMDGSKVFNVTASALANTASINIAGNITSAGEIQAAGNIQSGGSIIASGNIQTNSSVTSKRIYLYDDGTPSPSSIGLKAPTDMIASGGASYVLTLPEKKGVAGQVLAAKDNAGTLEWTSPSTGSVTSVTADLPLSVTGTASSPNVSLTKATSTVDGYLSAADFSTFASKQSAGNYITNLTGDVSSAGYAAGSITTSVDKIKGTPISGTPTLDGQVLRYSAGNFVPNFVSMLDLRSRVTGSQALSGSCGPDRTLTFDSLTDSLACSLIAINKSQVTGLGALTGKDSVDLATVEATGVLPISKGGTNSSTALTNNRLMVSSAGSIVELATANNAVLRTDAAGVPSWSVISNDDFQQYALLEGRSGGQTLRGGTSANENLTLDSTIHGTKGNVLINPTGGRVGVGTSMPTAALDVQGKVRGVASFGHGSSSTTTYISTSTSTVNSDIQMSIQVQEGDVVKVDLGCNLRNSGTGTTYMRSHIYSSPGGEWLQQPNWITASGQNWIGGLSTGIYKATASGTLNFRGFWHISSGTGEAVYCNINGFVLGKFN